MTPLSWASLHLRLFAAMTLLAIVVTLLPISTAQATTSNQTVACTNGIGDTADLVAKLKSAGSSNTASTLVLGKGCTYRLTAVNTNLSGPNGLPAVSNKSTGGLTIEGNGATILRDPAAPAFRIFYVSGKLTLSNVTIAGGQAAGNGGAIYNTGSLTLIESTLSGNSAQYADGSLGGAIYNAGSASIERSTLSDNQVSGGSTATSRSYSTSGPARGGAIYNADSKTLSISNSTISGNRAVGGKGGAIYNDDGTVTIKFSTITANSIQAGAAGATMSGSGAESSSGDGIYAHDGRVSFGSTIIFANGSQDCTGSRGSLVSLGNNLTRGSGGCPTVAATDLTPPDAGLLPLANNGGPTLTHALSAESPAIDRGASTKCPVTDQRRSARPQGPRCDIGAFEADVGPLNLLVTSNADSGPNTLREAIDKANARPTADTISFNLPAGQQIISLAAELPLISNPVTIDGTSQPGYAGLPLITLDGSDTGNVNGLTITSAQVTLRGLQIRDFTGAGILLNGPGNTTIESNTIVNNAGPGVLINSGEGNKVRSNSIFNNGGLGIDIAPAELNVNDSGDADAGPNQGQNFPLLTQIVELDGSTRVEGTLDVRAGHSYTIDLYGNDACDASGYGEGQRFLGSTGSPLTGSNFSIDLPRTDLAGQSITAVATDDGGNSSEFSACAPVRTNDLWTNALPLALAPTGVANQTGASASQLISFPYQERWYQLPITPGSRVRITLNAQPGSTLALHRDMEKVYTELANPQSAAEQAAAELPAGYLPAGYLPAGYLPAGYLPAGYLPAGYLPAGYLPAGYLPAGYLPAGYLPAGYLPAGYLPAGYLPAGYLPAGYLPEIYSGAVRQSLMAFAGDPQATVLTIDRNTWDLDENLYIRVTQPVGGQPFTLQVTVDGGQCGNLSPPSGAIIAGGQPAAGSADSLIVWDSRRLDMGGVLSSFASQVNGLLIDLADTAKYPRVAAARQELTENVSCAAAANLLADEIKSVIDAYRGQNPTVRSIVLVGDDTVIPFFRYPDTAGLAGESEYIPPVVEESASNASLRQNRVLGQDAYGSTVGIWRGSYTLPIPDLAVGRLVGDASVVSAMLNAYTGAGGAVTAGSALVTGYDFVADTANAVSDDLALGLSQAPHKLIQPVGEAPTGPNAWTADQLRAELLSRRNDLVFLTGHFAAGAMLASDYSSGLLASEVLGASTNFTNSIVFALGCHSGYNIPTPDSLAGYSPEPDWPEAFNSRGASYVAATGFAYGDTRLIEYGERYLLGLARQLRTGSGPVALGDAVVRAKQEYLSGKANLSGIDEKTLLQFALFGLPMLQVNMPGQRLGVDTDASIVTSVTVADGPGATYGLQIGQTTDATNDISPLTRTNVALTNIVDNSSVTASYYSGRGGVVANPIDPIMPLEQRNVSVDGRVLRGVGFRGGSFSDEANFVPLTSAPTTEESRGHAAFFSDTFYPIQNWSYNAFASLADGPTRLMLTPAQFVSNGLGETKGTMRTYQSMDFRFFYMDAGWTSGGADLRAAGVAAAPEIAVVKTARFPSNLVEVRANVIDKGSVGIQEVWITYTGPGNPGRWDSIDLIPAGAADPTLWITPAGGVNLPDGTVFMVQAVSATGRVSLATNNGRYYTATPPTTSVQGDPTSITLLNPPTSGAYGLPQSFSARLDRVGGAPVASQFMLLLVGSQLTFATTDASGVANFSLTLSQAPGDYTVQLRFLGSDSEALAASSQTGGFMITKDNTQLSLAPAGPLAVYIGDDTGVIATLRTTGGTPIADRTIVFVADNGAQRFGQAVKTGPGGRAVLGVVPWPVGSYTVSAYFADPSGLPAGTPSAPDLFYNGSASTSLTLTIAAPPPDTEITAGPSGTSFDTVTSFSFTGSSSRLPLSFECSLDNVEYTSCTSPARYTKLAEGQHTFRVRAIDADGQRDPTPAERIWTVQMLYRAREEGKWVWIERNIALAGLGDYDDKPVDGWALVGRTNGTHNKAELRDFYVEGGIPYAIIFERATDSGDADRYNNRCILITPESLAVVKKNRSRLTKVVQDPVECPAP